MSGVRIFTAVRRPRRTTTTPPSHAGRNVRAGCTALLLPALVAALLTGCAQARDPQVACDWMKKGAEEEARREGHSVFLVDVSASVRGSTSSSGGVDHSAGTLENFEKWVGDVGTFSVAAFGGDVHDIRWVAREWAADPGESGNKRTLKRRAGSVTECVRDAVAEAQATVPERGGSDVLGAVREAGILLAGDEGPRRLVVLTDGLQTTGCADLRNSDFDGEADRDMITERCRSGGDLTPATLDSVSTVFVGLGRTARDEPQPSPGQVTWLTGLWSRLCAVAHASSDRSEEDCGVTDTPAAQLGEEAAGERPRDPAVAFPQRTYKQVGDRALFDPDSSVIREEALPLLARIADEVGKGEDSRVRVQGYVDPRGGSANNRELSQARADAVKAELTRLGVRGVTAVGKGVADECPGAASEAGNLSKEQKLQCDRRVDIVVVR
ncbi:OmpA family protein [Streptomyces sp. NPDC056749]|uniref:OmpA family protein n=1 Tax=Streptomyces sp. NPDC056749 TaxID=3345936 RepID=UPI00368CCADC